MNKKFQIAVTVILSAVVIGHIWAFANNSMGIDQFIPAVLGYFAIWVILMAYDIESDDKPYENINHDVIHKELDAQLIQASEDLSEEKTDNVLICNNCKRYWKAPKEKCICGSSTLTKTHPNNIKLVEKEAI